MPRPIPLAVAALAASAVVAAVASAQGPAPPATAPPATAPTAPAAPAGPPSLDSLRLPKVVSAQQGHARFLVGVRLATPARLTVQIVAARDGKLVRNTIDSRPRDAGRAYFRVEAVDTRGFQILPGAYRLRLTATDDRNRVSPVLEAPFTLKLTPPRGLFDAATVPLWRAFRKGARTAAKGQLVAVVAPKGTAAVAGIRRGDVITSVNGVPTPTPGALAVALRALPAQKAVPVTLVRRAQPLTVQMEPNPDWEKAPDHGPSLAVAIRRDPKVFAYPYARVRLLLDAGRLDAAEDAIADWPRSWRRSAPGQLILGDLLAKRTRWKPALGAYNRARARDEAMGAAEFGRGLALSELGRSAPSARAFAAAAADDPADPAAESFLAYAMLRAGRTPEAVAAGQRAVRLDPRYADSFLPLGIAQLGSGERKGGVRALRRGLILLEDAERADRLIAQHLDRADP